MSAMKTEIIQKIVSVSLNSLIKTDEYMSGHTTFRTGGPADVFIVPDSVTSLGNIIKVLKDEDVPYYIVGRGSNLLVGDKGFRGVIICVYNTMNDVSIEYDKDNAEVKSGAGILLNKLAMTIANEGLKGFEYAAGIPGTLGGAVAMNAGAYGGEIKDSILSATVMDRDGNIRTLSKEELELEYRNSAVLKKGYIVLEACFSFDKGEKSEILSKIEELNGMRREKQPLEYPSAGSTFKRPEGYFAGKLIQDSGLAGYRVGGACVSNKHCGFVVNDNNGTSADIVKVIKDVDKTVYDKYGVHLEPEVRMIGDFSIDI